jgi:hypothetical protein
VGLHASLFILDRNDRLDFLVAQTQAIQISLNARNWPDLDHDGISHIA